MAPAGASRSPIAFSCKDYGADAWRTWRPRSGRWATTSRTRTPAGNSRSRSVAAARTASCRARSRRPSWPPTAATPCRWSSRRGLRATGAAHRTWWRPRSRRSPDTSGRGDGAPLLASWVAVRRLTPRECERLQGFPDDWTLIPGYSIKLQPRRDRRDGRVPRHLD